MITDISLFFSFSHLLIFSPFLFLPLTGKKSSFAPFLFLACLKSEMGASGLVQHGFWSQGCNGIASSCKHLHAGILRGVLADYGVPLLVVVWTALSYALQSGGNPRGVPSGVPRRVSSPLTWQVDTARRTICHYDVCHYDVCHYFVRAIIDVCHYFVRTIIFMAWTSIHTGEGFLGHNNSDGGSPWSIHWCIDHSRYTGLSVSACQMIFPRCMLPILGLFSFS